MVPMPQQEANCDRSPSAACGQALLLRVPFPRLIETVPRELVRKMLLLDLPAWVVVRVAVAPPVAHRAHQAGDRVAQVQWNWQVAGLANGGAGCHVGAHGRVRLGGSGQE